LPSRASAIGSPQPSQITTGRTLSGDISIFNGMRDLRIEHPFVYERSVGGKMASRQVKAGDSATGYADAVAASSPR
jgi:hypothetical protein